MEQIGLRQMKNDLHKSWRTLRDGKPGDRFEKRYRAEQRSRNGRTWAGRIVRWTIAAAALAIGIVLVFIPGPAVLFFLLAGTLLASDSLILARTLDWCEVRIRTIAARLHRIWVHLSMAGKIAVAAAGAALSAASTYGCYRLFS